MVPSVDYSPQVIEGFELEPADFTHAHALPTGHETAGLGRASETEAQLDDAALTRT